MDSEFTPHGSHIISSSGNLLTVDAYGPWNREAAQKYEDKARKEIKAVLRSYSQWAMLIRVHGLSIYTPDSIPILQQFHKWRLEQNMHSIAIVCCECEDISTVILKNQLKDVYGFSPETPPIEKYFLNKDDALVWLKEKGFGN